MKLLKPTMILGLSLLASTSQATLLAFYTFENSTNDVSGSNVATTATNVTFNTNGIDAR